MWNRATIGGHPMSKKDEKFPKTIYVKREVDGDLSYFTATEDLGDVASINDIVTVGKYKLQKELDVYAWPTTDEDE
jgi:hypothetical protein